MRSTDHPGTPVRPSRSRAPGRRTAATGATLVALAAVLVTGTAVAADETPTEFHACLDDKGRLADVTFGGEAPECGAKATAVSWSARGAEGVAGPKGEPGPQGEQGEPGPAGPQGEPGELPDQQCPEGTFVTGIADGVLACSTLEGDHAPQSLTPLQVRVQPISVCLDDGTECAPAAVDEALLDEIWAQAAIDVVVLPAETLDSTRLVEAECGGAFLDEVEAVLPDSLREPAPLKLFIANCAEVGGNGWVGFNGMSVHPELIDAAPIVVARYVGYNLGLSTRQLADPAYQPGALMNPTILDSGNLLLEDEISQARESRFLEPVAG
ncbi:hypothetical protein ARHIZOSPH14_21470 [Agromyces rhizosphaerae]|uniref:Collagen-like protein n=1 Tax=Agromyces rhizosphaerae TaxID=88374 RepID=A0A9W6CYB8_9MICO|nr:hypothetical protein [Agromyces rhizosphaerae]GLI27905.1 hypothetical protein ARHIZOSPH14_21470 [Agromyces rhizosphaerae]